jgi:hypothetical protein
MTNLPHYETKRVKVFIFAIAAVVVVSLSKWQ